MTQFTWVLCPICGGKTRTKIRPDTEAKNLIVFCPKCKSESVVDIKDMKSKTVGNIICVNTAKGEKIYSLLVKTSE